MLTLIVFVYQTRFNSQTAISFCLSTFSVNQSSIRLIKLSIRTTQSRHRSCYVEKYKDYPPLRRKYESLAEYITSEFNEEDSIFFYNSDIYEGRLIHGEEEIPLFGLISEKELKKYGIKNTIHGANKLRSIINNDSLEVEITYESIYEERWSISNWDPRLLKIKRMVFCTILLNNKLMLYKKHT